MEFKDFDLAWEEAGGDEASTPIERKFQFAGDMFLARLNPNAGSMLHWMRSASKLESTPLLLEMFVGEESLTRMIDLMIEQSINWDRMVPLIEWLAEEMTQAQEGNTPG